MNEITRHAARIAGDDPSQAKPSSSAWDRHIAPWLERHFWLVLIALLISASIRITSTYNRLSLTIDEPTHVACGLELLSQHRYTRDPIDPPLARTSEAFGPWLVGVRPQGIEKTSVEGLSEIAASGNVHRTISLARLGNLPFFLLAASVVCIWGCRAFGRPTAIVATGMFCLTPAVLADAGFATADIAACATVGAAFLSLLVWAEAPTWRSSFVFGVCLAMVVLAKLSGAGYLLSAGGLALVTSVACNRHRTATLLEAKKRVPALVFAIGVAALCTWAGYGFTYGEVMIGHRETSVPAPALLMGVKALVKHNQAGHLAFLLGRTGFSGWWYYFPVALAVKTPLPILLLAGLGAITALRSQQRPQGWLPLVYVAGILLPAMLGHINIGIRHIEPIWIGIALLGAFGLRRLLEASHPSPLRVTTAIALLVWLLTTGAFAHPDYASYFNALAGGQPENVLVDSNNDWGQHLVLVGKRLQERGATQIAIADMDGIVEAYPRRYEALHDWYGLPRSEKLDPCRPALGWNVVSTTVYQFATKRSGQRSSPDIPLPWYAHIAPTERVGPLLLYNLNAASRQQLGSCK